MKIPWYRKYLWRICVALIAICLIMTVFIFCHISSTLTSVYIHGGYYVYDCNEIDAPKNKHLFPNDQLEQAFWSSNKLFFETLGINYSITGGTLLQMYRNCGLQSDADDIDFVVPLKYLPKIRDVFLNSPDFSKGDFFGKPNEIGYQLSFYYKNETKIDIFSMNNMNGSIFMPLWVHGDLRACWISNDTKFGTHKLRIKEHEFYIMGPIDKSLEMIYGKNWTRSIPTADWDWVKSTCFTLNHTNIYLLNSTNSDKLKKKRIDCSCLNNIFDEIFVISIKSRYKQLLLTLYQLNEENINYTVWEGHNAANPHSMKLWNRFKHNIRSKHKSKHIPLGDVETSLYLNPNRFALRKTQIDIIKYSKQQKYKKILIFEDDILLSNPYWINMFCNMEPFIPSWYVINLGVNQDNPKERVSHFMHFPNNSDVEMKYYTKKIDSLGTYGIAISFEFFEYMFDIFDIDVKFKHSARIRYRCFNIDPTLIIQNRTTDHNISHFSKYWNLRFLNHTQSYIDKITAVIPSFQQLVAESPSNKFLMKK